MDFREFWGFFMKIFNFSDFSKVDFFYYEELGKLLGNYGYVLAEICSFPGSFGLIGGTRPGRHRPSKVFAIWWVLGNFRDNPDFRENL